VLLVVLDCQFWVVEGYVELGISFDYWVEAIERLQESSLACLVLADEACNSTHRERPGVPNGSELTHVNRLQLHTPSISNGQSLMVLVSHSDHLERRLFGLRLLVRGRLPAPHLSQKGCGPRTPTCQHAPHTSRNSRAFFTNAVILKDAVMPGVRMEDELGVRK